LQRRCIEGAGCAELVRCLEGPDRGPAARPEHAVGRPGVVAVRVQRTLRRSALFAAQAELGRRVGAAGAQGVEQRLAGLAAHRHPLPLLILADGLAGRGIHATADQGNRVAALAQFGLYARQRVRIHRLRARG
jgi:hypothetical protein